MRGAFYNEIDRYCCDWLQNLMDAGLITAGVICDKSIVDLSPDDVRGYERCHFFAGIAGWELALSLSGYTGPVWTGSCPCQPFSAAGKGKASGDERHLWPEWFRLIKALRPPVLFGEQVEAAIGWGWLDLVHSDLGQEGYTIREVVLPACSVGAPHIRQRLWFVANSEVGASISPQDAPATGRWGPAELRTTSSDGELADATHNGQPRQQGTRPRRSGVAHDSILGHANEPGSQGWSIDAGKHASQCSPWEASSLVWLPCTDGKQRPTQPSIFPLAHGVPARVAKLRAAGNAIIPQVAAEFIKANM